MNNYEGRDVSIILKRDLGTFQGKIIAVSPSHIKINNAFHNGMKIKKFESEIQIGKDEIENIEFLIMPSPAPSDLESSRIVNNTQKIDQPQKVQTPHKTNGTGTYKNIQHSSKSPQVFEKPKPFVDHVDAGDFGLGMRTKSKPIAIEPRASSSNSKSYLSASLPQDKTMNFMNKTDVFKKNKTRRNNFDLNQEDFTDEDFDFEGNLALFDKQTIFQEIEDKIFGKKPDLVRQITKQSEMYIEEKFRHDENVLDGQMYRQIQLEFKAKQEYSTDEPGILIPSIPHSLRNRIQNLAESHGFSFERQNDFLARGAVEVALTLLGGSRRLSPKNIHQWPRVTLICDEPYNFRQSEIGLSTVRQLASHGLKVMVYVKTSSHSEKPSKELELYTASGNDFTYSIQDLPDCDLVIMAVKSMNQNSQVIRYIQQSRAPVLALDPPATGISEVSIRSSVIPILPLDDINQASCGKLHLVNIPIPQKFWNDAGVKYFPVFGSKFVIPLHLKH